MANQPNLPPIVNVVIQLGALRLRASVGAAHGPVSIPRACLCVDAGSGMVLHFEVTEPLDDYLPIFLKSLFAIGNQINGLPRQLQVRDPVTAAELRRRLQPLGVDVVVRESLPQLDEAAQSLQEYKRLGGMPQPGLLDLPGMSLDRVIAFADAANAFVQAKPWHHLVDDDLIAIDPPAGPPGTQFAQVLGAGGQTFGLSFVASREAHEKLSAGGSMPRGGLWTLFLTDIDAMPFDDGEAWERHGLPVAAIDAYPSFLRRTASGKFHYPTPQQLTWAEGLLRAIAQTTEDQLDSGQWQVHVDTHDGGADYRLSLPLLLEQLAGKRIARREFDPQSAQATMQSMMRGLQQQLARRKPASLDEANQMLAAMIAQPPAFEPTTDLERAQALCDQAEQARGRRQVQLARAALALDPDCAEALLLLGNLTGDPDASFDLLRRAVVAAQRRLGPELFEQQAGHFWMIHETRPYMRARQELALALIDQDQPREAADHLADLLRLNPGDNQGNRYHLAHCLLDLGELDRLDALLNCADYKHESSAEWAFTKLLLAYRRDADSPQTHQCLAQAQRVNPYVAPLLAGRLAMPAAPPQMYSPGSVEEAALCADEMADAWAQTDGAIEWLRKITKPTRRPARSKTATRAKKPKRR